MSTTRYTNALRQTRWRIEERLAKAKTHADVIAAFSAEPHNTPNRKSLLADAFFELDRYHTTPNHGLLRQVRNTPELGRQLFALWSNS